jgi:hypothetical protein
MQLSVDAVEVLQNDVFIPDIDIAVSVFQKSSLLAVDLRRTGSFFDV